MGHQGQKFPGRVEFAPATKVGVPSFEEIDGPLRFPCPCFVRQYLTFSCIDVNHGAYWKQGLQGVAVVPEKDGRSTRVVWSRPMTGFQWIFVNARAEMIFERC